MYNTYSETTFFIRNTSVLEAAYAESRTGQLTHTHTFRTPQASNKLDANIKTPKASVHSHLLPALPQAPSTNSTQKATAFNATSSTQRSTRKALQIFDDIHLSASHNHDMANTAANAVHEATATAVAFTAAMDAEAVDLDSKNAARRHEDLREIVECVAEEPLGSCGGGFGDGEVVGIVSSEQAGGDGGLVLATARSSRDKYVIMLGGYELYAL